MPKAGETEVYFIEKTASIVSEKRFTRSMPSYLDIATRLTTMNLQLKQRIVFALLMGIVTTGIISFTLISINVGYIDNFLRIWLRSWAMAYGVVIPAILFIGPRLQAIVNKLIK